MNRDLRAIAQLRLSWMCLSVLLVLAVAMSVACEPEPEPEPEDVDVTSGPIADESIAGGGITHVLHIRSVGGEIQVRDDGGNNDKDAERGDWILWNNHTGADIELEFSRVQKLFGVWNAVSYSTGAPLKLQVRDDAEYVKHTYLPQGPAVSVPPPAIIINPPPN